MVNKRFWEKESLKSNLTLYICLLDRGTTLFCAQSAKIYFDRVLKNV